MVDLDKAIEMSDVQSNCRVALKNDSYKLHKILPNKVLCYHGIKAMWTRYCVTMALRLCGQGTVLPWH